MTNQWVTDNQSIVPIEYEEQLIEWGTEVVAEVARIKPLHVELITFVVIDDQIPTLQHNTLMYQYGVHVVADGKNIFSTTEYLLEDGHVYSVQTNDERTNALKQILHTAQHFKDCILSANRGTSIEELMNIELPEQLYRI